jgi:hypothetical protein
MKARFPEAMVSAPDTTEVQQRYHSRLPVQDEDNHLLAAGIAAPAWAAITYSHVRLRPYYTVEETLLPEALAPAEFLSSIEAASPEAVRQGVHTAALQYHEYEESHSRVLTALRREGMGSFVARLVDMEDVFH